MILPYIPRVGGIKIGELIFIGTGVGSGDGLSIKALSELKKADAVYLESYTGLVTDNMLGRLKELIGKEPIRVDRDFIEDGKKLLDESAVNKTTAILTIGDPMSATTHIDLRLRAFDLGIPTRILYGSSIFTAAPGLCGLQQYKFGRTTTLAFPRGNYFPESPYTIIGDNLGLDLHTLILLELTTEDRIIMTAADGIKILLDLESKHEKGFVSENTLICAVARVGFDNASATAGYIRDLKNQDFGEPMHCLILPGKLHFKEAEALVKLCGAPETILEKVD